MKRCLVVGAGGAGREILSWALQVQQTDWKIAGFLDANPDALVNTPFPYSVLGSPGTWQPSEDEVFIAALGNPATRLRVCSDLESRGARFLTIVHPSVILALSVEIGQGTVICPGVIIGANAKIGNSVLINLSATIGHDAVIGDGATVSCHCDIMGYARIGEGSFLGGHACILSRKRVGDGAIVGAGSVVVRNVAPRSTVMGVPAQVLISPVVP